MFYLGSGFYLRTALVFTALTTGTSTLIAQQFVSPLPFKEISWESKGDDTIVYTVDGVLLQPTEAEAVQRGEFFSGVVAGIAKSEGFQSSEIKTAGINGEAFVTASGFRFTLAGSFVSKAARDSKQPQITSVKLVGFDKKTGCRTFDVTFSATPLVWQRRNAAGIIRDLMHYIDPVFRENKAELELDIVFMDTSAPRERKLTQRLNVYIQGR